MVPLISVLISATSLEAGVNTGLKALGVRGGLVRRTGNDTAVLTTDPHDRSEMKHIQCETSNKNTSAMIGSEAIAKSILGTYLVIILPSLGIDISPSALDDFECTPDHNSSNMTAGDNGGRPLVNGLYRMQI